MKFTIINIDWKGIIDKRKEQFKFSWLSYKRICVQKKKRQIDFICNDKIFHILLLIVFIVLNLYANKILLNNVYPFVFFFFFLGAYQN